MIVHMDSLLSYCSTQGMPADAVLAKEGAEAVNFQYPVQQDTSIEIEPRFDSSFKDLILRSARSASSL